MLITGLYLYKIHVPRYNDSIITATNRRTKKVFPRSLYYSYYLLHKNITSLYTAFPPSPKIYNHTSLQNAKLSGARVSLASDIRASAIFLLLVA
jgi:hypothetical protein